MKTKTTFIYIGIAACLLFVILDLGCDIWFGRSTPNYDWLRESISRLGEVGSPMQTPVMIWGISSAALLLLFANAFKLVFPSTMTVRLATAAISIYAMGEGLGSGLFPIDQLNTPITASGALHEILSVIGDVGIVSLPFILLRIPHFQNHKSFKRYLKWVIAIGFLCIALFTLAKYVPQFHTVSDYKGLWQRFYTFNYHLMLVILCFKMIPLMPQNRF